jgi:hypothetical protein
MRIESDERRQPRQARCDQDRRRAAHMRPESQAQASDRRCAPPHRLVWAVGGLPHTADRRMIAVQEPASGKCRITTIAMARRSASHPEFSALIAPCEPSPIGESAFKGGHKSRPPLLAMVAPRLTMPRAADALIGGRVSAGDPDRIAAPLDGRLADPAPVEHSRLGAGYREHLLDHAAVEDRIELA